MERNALCPGCNKEGDEVPAKTIQSLVKPEIKQKLKTFDRFRFCATPDCVVVYYNPETVETILKDQVKTVVFQKSKEPDRKVCYCFGYTVRQIQEDALRHGKSRLLEELKSKCKQGKPRCVETNPQGKCCLNNIIKIVEETLGEKLKDTDASCCCSSNNDRSGSSSQSGCKCC
ncbi:MAG: hypothetical protein N2487_05640 [Verrucomicrobiae bacterium]|nr:hypothetical protein [Verrucomicrobiae bacterium]